MEIHITSATQIVTDNGQHVLAMCGVDLGVYGEASKIHPVGNYLLVGGTHWKRVTCSGCKNRITR